ncbi:hypothetical protein [Trichococcus ilyis]|uniref:Uncharacterized protein n=1 Tax=Trichococcus ilyis TaxID=640938 RepID=A0A143Z4V0_9LACT|nr:hypothetical protein [Trichococcus ilyis]CZR07818.1 Hypothetical protein TR210_2488 [Trichococcus ilyis]SEJ82606.1 hypothetical protein SAMN05216375_12927 [Trichococcus ilyis]
MHKIVSISLDERVVDLLDDEIIREPDCHNRSQLIRKIIQQYFAAKGNVAKKIETKTNLGELEKEVAIVKQLVGALVFNSYSNLESTESETPLSLSATTDLPLIEESIIHEVLEKKLSKKSEGKA